MADIETLMPLIKQFMPFAQERMGFSDPPRLFVKGDAQNAANPLGKTAFYDPAQASVTLYITDRHPKDVMRSLSHELVHHTQNCNGDFSDAGEMGEGYAQNNPRMREMERQAYEMGNMCFRDWEDSIKQTIYFEHLQKGDYTMSIKDWKNGELKSLLSEAWGFKMDLNKLIERGGPGGDLPADPYGEKKAEEDEPTKREKEGNLPLEEDTGEEEAWHDWKNEHADDDHLREMEHHLRALREDRDYEERGAEYDDDRYEDKGYDRRAEIKLKEDTGEEEAWHDWKNEHADDDHIREMEHHLRALREDKEYEERGAEYDDDRYEDKGMEEGGTAARPENLSKGEERRMKTTSAMRETKLRNMIRQAIKEAMK